MWSVDGGIRGTYRSPHLSQSKPLHQHHPLLFTVLATNKHIPATRLRSHVGRTCRSLLSPIIPNSNLVFAPPTAVTPLEMGHSLPTSLRGYLPSATCRAPTTCTITLLRSLGDPDGVFDIPNAKCPPDGGSSDCVTGGLAPIISQSPDSSFSPSPPEKTSPINNIFISTRIPTTVPPRYIPARSGSPFGLPTPPLTPDDSDASGAHGIFTKHSKDALDLLLNIFPRNGLSILPFATSVVVSVPNMGATFDGVALELPGKPKTLYVNGKNAPAVSLRESIVALLELADEHLQCSALVIVLDKSFNGLNDLLHSLMYVGGCVVTKPPFQVNPAYILVGLEI